MRQGLAAGGLDQAQVDDAISGLSTLIALMAEGPPGLTLTTAAGQQDHGERIALFLDKLWQRERQYISELLIKQIEVTELKRAMGLL